MSMSKKDFIALADAIREHNKQSDAIDPFQKFSSEQLDMLADFCQRQNSNFMRERWLAYIAGECGPNGGAVKKAKPDYKYCECGREWGECATQHGGKEHWNA